MNEWIGGWIFSSKSSPSTIFIGALSSIIVLEVWSCGGCLRRPTIVSTAKYSRFSTVQCHSTKGTYDRFVFRLFYFIHFVFHPPIPISFPQFLNSKRKSLL